MQGIRGLSVRFRTVGLHTPKYIDKKFSLYALHKFFVEVELSAMDKIVGMKTFKSGSLMEKYVGKIGF